MSTRNGYLYISYSREGLAVFGPYEHKLQAEHALLVDVLNTLTDVPGTIVEDHNDDIVNDAWSDTGYAMKASKPGLTDIRMYLRVIGMDRPYVPARQKHGGG